MSYVFFNYITLFVLKITHIASHIKNNKTKERIGLIWKQLNCNRQIGKPTSSSREFLPVSMVYQTAKQQSKPFKYSSNNTAFVWSQTSCSQFCLGVDSILWGDISSCSYPRWALIRLRGRVRFNNDTIRKRKSTISLF